MMCPTCKREIRPWPLRRPAKCSPKHWAYCIRSDMPEAYTMEPPEPKQFRILYRKPGEFGWTYGWGGVRSDCSTRLWQSLKRNKPELQWKVDEILPTDVDYVKD